MPRYGYLHIRRFVLLFHRMDLGEADEFRFGVFHFVNLAELRVRRHSHLEDLLRYAAVPISYQ